MSSTADYWGEYYQTRDDSQIPWSGVSEKVFTWIFKETGLKSPLNILDVGCGKGDKSIYLAKLGNEVIGIDIAKSAIETARKKAEGIDHKPKFYVTDLAILDKTDPIAAETKFDLVLDLLASQFLEQEEKTNYLGGLKKHLKSSETWMVLNCFVKDSIEDRLEGVEEWIKKIAQTKEEIEAIYGQYFKVKSASHRTLSSGRKLGWYLFRAK